MSAARSIINQSASGSIWRQAAAMRIGASASARRNRRHVIVAVQTQIKHRRRWRHLMAHIKLAA